MAVKMHTIHKHHSKSAFAERAWSSRERRLKAVAIAASGNLKDFEKLLKIAIADRRVKARDIADCCEIIGAVLPYLDGIRNYRTRRREDRINEFPAFYRALTATESGADTRDAVVASINHYGREHAELKATEQYSDVLVEQCKGCYEVAKSLGMETGSIQCKECIEKPAREAAAKAAAEADAIVTAQRDSCELCKLARDNNLGDACYDHLS